MAPSALFLAGTSPSGSLDFPGTCEGKSASLIDWLYYMFNMKNNWREPYFSICSRYWRMVCLKSWHFLMSKASNSFLIILEIFSKFSWAMSTWKSKDEFVGCIIFIFYLSLILSNLLSQSVYSVLLASKFSFNLNSKCFIRTWTKSPTHLCFSSLIEVPLHPLPTLPGFDSLLM